MPKIYKSHVQDYAVKITRSHPLTHRCPRQRTAKIKGSSIKATSMTTQHGIKQHDRACTLRLSLTCLHVSFSVASAVFSASSCPFDRAWWNLLFLPHCRWLFSRKCFWWSSPRGWRVRPLSPVSGTTSKYLRVTVSSVSCLGGTVFAVGFTLGVGSAVCINPFSDVLVGLASGRFGSWNCGIRDWTKLPGTLGYRCDSWQ